MNPEFLEQLASDGIPITKTSRFELLTGGVSSEIYRIDTVGKTFVVKRALKKLKVQSDWFADVSRNDFEIKYLEYVSQFLPEAVPRLLGKGQGYFVMEFLDKGFANWKTLLMEGEFQESHAREAGKLLGRIHQYSYSENVVAEQFNSLQNFTQLRISPYLLRCAERHPLVAREILKEAERLKSTNECLIHGDYSPKNILISGKRLVILDCEVAFYGDAAFDIAFLSSHLLLKGLYHAPRNTNLENLVSTFLVTYGKQREGFQDFQKLQKRTAILLPMLLLARVDGKSPVEYLDPDRQALAREFALKQIVEKNSELQDIIQTWFKKLKNSTYLN
ncbi:phosphotransferase [Ulvibacterium sp.]|uniref:phosphotransferase family protein n=1 Tax=Ulvibacterium sp. TaxID=2665914 RepID=UPI0026089663|nr:phosphotransferase [Ulvibacterium sp.]